MKKISGNTFYFKKVFPTFWFGFLGLFFLVSLFGIASQEGLTTLVLPFLIMPIFMAVFGYVLMKKLVWDLADEVYDCGSYLLVKRKDQKEHISLSNIMNVESMISNPPRITLTLRVPSPAFGKKIAFSPFFKFTLNPFKSNEIVDELIIRVDQARRGDSF